VVYTSAAREPVGNGSLPFKGTLMSSIVIEITNSDHISSTIATHSSAINNKSSARLKPYIAIMFEPYEMYYSRCVAYELNIHCKSARLHKQ